MTTAVVVRTRKELERRADVLAASLGMTRQQAFATIHEGRTATHTRLMSIRFLLGEDA